MSKRKAKSVFVLIMSLVMIAAPVCAMNEEQFEANLERTNDWVIYIDTERKKEFLKFEGAKVNQVANLRVSYRKTSRRKEDNSIRTYEDLWYHQGKALGSRRYCMLNIEKQRQGTIYVRPSGDVVEEPRAVANAIIRLMIELIVKDIIVVQVIVPKDMFREVVAQMNEFGFGPPMYPMNGMQMSVFLYSRPGGLEAGLYYRKKRQDI